jgi:S-DNA-T family DNA segregation ATPase FtsK/SpoIIIE
MAVLLPVRDVRDALHRGATPGDGAPSNRLLGRFFHEVFTELAGPDPRMNLEAALAELDPEPEPRLRAVLDHVYQRLVGPRLVRSRSRLHQSSAEVVSFWQAVEALCGWLLALRDGGGVVAPAGPLDLELRDPRWSDSVRLVGIPDGLVHSPGTGRWCVVELKLGRTSPEADLAQTCLYHMMLSTLDRGGPSRAGSTGALALVSFEPERRERLFETGELHEVRRTLHDLIGRLAGVLPEPAPPPEVERPPAEPVEAPHVELGERLVAALAEYGAVVHPHGPPVVGPTFLRFPFTLGTGIKLAAIQGRVDELRIRLGLDVPPQIGVQGGRVVIDVQRPDRQFLRFSSIRGQLPAPDPLRGSSRVPLGVDLEGRLFCADLAQPEHAHLLVAGSTGSGKSEWLRVAVAGLLAANSPETLRLLLIDPKRNAFAALRDSPFLLEPIVYPDEQAAAGVLARLAAEMESRYILMAEAGSDNLAEHVQRTGTPLPRIVCVCDEYADLLLRDRQERKEVEHQVFRLGSKARAAGIHLIIATQQPSREIIKGALDANIPARVGLKMERSIESRMLLGEPGAERLLGYGDLLFKDLGQPIRLQSAHLPPDEREEHLTGRRFFTASPASGGKRG